MGRLLGLLILVLIGLSEVTYLAGQTRRIPDDEDDAFPLIVLDALSMLFTVMPVQLKLRAEAALAKKA